ncbi:MAG: hypothetical protein AAFR52_14875, partial [Pseudomonadota bacterium]
TFDTNIGAQLDRFLAGDPITPGGVQPNPVGDAITASYFSGLNDIGDFALEVEGLSVLQILARATAFLVELTATARAQILDIAESGLVSQIIIYTLPDITYFPIPDGVTQAELDPINSVIDTYNVGLRQIAVEADAVDGIDVAVVEVDEITDLIDASPLEFGFLAKGPFYFGGGTELDVTFFPEFSVSIETNDDVAGIPLRQIQFFDQLHPSAAVHSILGSFAAASVTSDTHVFDTSPSLFFAGRGADFVIDADGDSNLFLGRGWDVALGAGGDDTIWGMRGVDIVSGGAGSDLIRGNAGNDFLAGGTGNDELRGGSRNDILLDGLGDDVVRGQAGNDTFVWVDPTLLASTQGSDRFIGNSGTDTLYLISDADGAAALETELAAQSGAAGDYTLAGGGIEVSGFENVVILDGGIDALSEVEAIDDRLLAEGLGWGFV